MVCKKTFTCSIEDIDGVITELADEIRQGYHVTELRKLDFEISYDIRPKPSFEVVLERREK